MFGLAVVLGPATVLPAMREGAVAVGALQDTLQDTLTHHFVDSVVVRSPLPDPLVPIVQWLFQKPGWVMALGIALAGLIAVALVLLAWRRRRAITTWLVTRERGVKLAMLGAVGAVVLLMVGSGLKAY